MIHAASAIEMGFDLLLHASSYATFCGQAVHEAGCFAVLLTEMADSKSLRTCG